MEVVAMRSVFSIFECSGSQRITPDQELGAFLYYITLFTRTLEPVTPCPALKLMMFRSCTLWQTQPATATRPSALGSPKRAATSLSPGKFYSFEKACNICKVAFLKCEDLLTVYIEEIVKFWTPTRMPNPSIKSPFARRPLSLTQKLWNETKWFGSLTTASTSGSRPLVILSYH